jgi:hypothetical protein
MKALLFSVAALLALQTAAAAQQSSWFLLPKARHHALVVVTASQAENVKDIGFVGSYGQTARAVAFASNNGNGGMVDVVDIASHQVTLSVPIADHPVAKQVGPDEALALTDSAAYFLTFRLSKRNELGGGFYLNATSLPDGQTESYPLPRDCQPGGVAMFAGIPLVYSYNRNGLYVFDPATHTLRSVLSKDDIADILSREAQALLSHTIPSNAESQFVVVPDAGVYRLSKVGTLDAVLDANLRPVQQPRQALDLGSSKSVLLYPARFDGQPAIAIVEQQNPSSRSTFEYVVTRALTVKWAVTLLGGINPDSIRPALGDAVLYVNPKSRAVEEISASGMRTLLSLKPMESLLTSADGPYALTGALLLRSNAP